MTYPNNPGFTAGIETSKIAASSVEKTSASMCRCLAAALKATGGAGITMDEATEVLTRLGFVGLVKNNVSARLGQLCADGTAFRSKDTRKSKDGKRPQSIYKLREYWTIFDLPQKTESMPQFRVWSNDHKGWRNSQGNDYCSGYFHASLYSFSDAIALCERAGCDEMRIPRETLIPATSHMDKIYGRTYDHQ